MSCSQSHMEDFDTLVACEKIREIAKTADGPVKQLVYGPLVSGWTAR